ncbi:Centrosomal protein of 72 kDa [Geodia barretti]|nr:Centrosomal protein of 72 kDa [Geodia barretti]
MHFTTAQACLPDAQPDVRTGKPNCSEQQKKHGALHAEMVHTIAPHQALQDNTDELLELAHSGSSVRAPMKANLMRNKSAARESHARIGHNEGDEAFSGFKVNLNFTPAPHTDVKCDSHSNEREALQKEFTAEFDEIMTQLITLLQQYVPTDISFLRQHTTLRDEIHKLWKQDAKTDGEDQRLQKELDDLRRQLDMKQSALETKDIELNSLSEQRRKLEAMCSELVHIQQDVHFKNDITQLLKQANTNILLLLEQLQEQNAQIKAALETSVQQSCRIGELESAKASLESDLRSNQQRRQSEAHANTKLRELTDMVQESHRSLVTTNDYLLKELEEAKLKHSQEVSQMLKNYQHLKKTHSYLLDTSKHV